MPEPKVKYTFENQADADAAMKAFMDKVGGQAVQNWSIDQLKAVLTLGHKARDAYTKWGGESGGHTGNVGVNGGVPQSWAAVMAQLHRKEKEAGLPLTNIQQDS